MKLASYRWAVRTSSKKMKLASFRSSSANKSESIKNTMVSRNRRASARYDHAKSKGKKQERNKLIYIIKIVFAKNHAYLMLTDFADPSCVLPALE